MPNNPIDWGDESDFWGDESDFWGAQKAPEPVAPSAPTDLTTGENLLRGGLSGTYGIGEAAGTILQYAGAIETGEKVENYFKAKREGVAPPESIQGSVYENPELLANLDWWAYNTAAIIPSLAVSIVPGMGAHKVLTALKTAPKLARLGSALTGGAAGGALEGSSTYQEVYAKALESGASDEEARAAASSGFNQMTAVSGLLNAASVDRFLKGLPDDAKGRAAARIYRGLTEAVTEWLEGPAEAAIMYNKEMMTVEEGIQKAKDELNVLGPAFLLGAVFPGAGQIPSQQAAPGAPPERPPGEPAPEAETVRAQAEGQAEVERETAEADMAGRVAAQRQTDEETITALETGQPLPEPGTPAARSQKMREERQAQVVALETDIGLIETPGALETQEGGLAGGPGYVGEPFEISPLEAAGQVGPPGLGEEPVPIPGAAPQLEPEPAIPVPAERPIEAPPVVGRAEVDEALEPVSPEIPAAAPERPAEAPEGEIELTPVDEAAAEAAPEAATEPQIEAGTYKKGHTRIGGLDISIENAAGTKRRPEWPTLKSHYGYFRRTEGKDGDQIDLFISPGTDAETAAQRPVFVVDQARSDGTTFDEHKVMVGFSTVEEARAAYLENYTKGWKGLKAITQVGFDEFKQWAMEGDTKAEFAKGGIAPPIVPPAAGPAVKPVVREWRGRLRRGEVMPTEPAAPAPSPAAAPQVETVQPGEKGVARQRADKAIKKYLRAKRPPGDDLERVISYRSEAAIGVYEAGEAEADPEVKAFLAAEHDWAVERLRELDPTVLAELGYFGKVEAEAAHAARMKRLEEKKKPTPKERLAKDRNIAAAKALSLEQISTALSNNRIVFGPWRADIELTLDNRYVAMIEGPITAMAETPRGTAEGFKGFVENRLAPKIADLLKTTPIPGAEPTEPTKKTGKQLLDERIKKRAEEEKAKAEAEAAAAPGPEPEPAPPAPPPKPAKPLAAIDMPSEEVQVEETGETVTITESAEAALARVDARLEALYALKDCVTV